MLEEEEVILEGNVLNSMRISSRDVNVSRNLFKILIKRTIPFTDEDIWLFKRCGYSSNDNPKKIMAVIDIKGKFVSRLVLQDLTPSISEILDHLSEIALQRPISRRIAIDCKEIHLLLSKILKCMDITVEYYDPLF